ncbi:Hypothetical predicted protein [Octopus vulgaris]|uniref:Uncharacterized protein n=1 Tax=Octopus vulgaris TaxID=6645 RepID=A0AA36EVZ9_OCTVU|nr:Hypothetical predicted protein [Octopus vulgaris]
MVCCKRAPALDGLLTKARKSLSALDTDPECSGGEIGDFEYDAGIGLGAVVAEDGCGGGIGGCSNGCSGGCEDDSDIDSLCIEVVAESEPDRPDETGIIVEGHGDDVNDVQLEKKIDDVDDVDPPQTTEEQNSNINLKDIGMWPANSNHGDGIQEILVQHGSKALQNIDCEFKEVVHPGQITKLKGETRRLSIIPLNTHKKEENLEHCKLSEYDQDLLNAIDFPLTLNKTFRAQFAISRIVRQG